MRALAKWKTKSKLWKKGKDINVEDIMVKQPHITLKEEMSEEWFRMVKE